MNQKSIISIIFLFFLFSSCKETNGELIESGVALADKGKYRDAIEKYTKVINKNSKIQLAYYNRGLCYISTGEYLNS